jgi:hypothetical protein
MATVTEPTQLRPVVTFPRDAVLDEEHLVAMGVASSIDKVKELNLPCYRVGRELKYICGQVLDELAVRAKKAI